MRELIDGKHLTRWFDSLPEYVEHSATKWHTYTRDHMQRSADWYGGVATPDQAVKLATEGLSADGVEALNTATGQVKAIDRELVSQQFTPFYDVAGADVDVSRYLSGEPENMVNYTLDDTVQIHPVVTLVVDVGASGHVTAEAITEHGQIVMSMMLAIESTGIQSEVWIDDYTLENTLDRDRETSGHSSRTTIRIKAAGEQFDPSRFMYALTHPSMLRAFMLNAMHHFPKPWHKPLRVGCGYGTPAHRFKRPEDYPPGAVFVRGPENGQDAHRIVHKVLKELNLLRED